MMFPEKFVTVLFIMKWAPAKGRGQLWRQGCIRPQGSRDQTVCSVSTNTLPDRKTGRPKQMLTLLPLAFNMAGPNKSPVLALDLRLPPKKQLT